MQFRQLRYFVKIVDAGSFSRAACVSAPNFDPNRRPTLTPPMALEVIGSEKEIINRLGSALDADRGANGSLIYNGAANR